MARRYVSVWFPHLRTDHLSLADAGLHDRPFVLRQSVHGRMVISATNIHAEKKGIHAGQVLADARAIVPGIEVQDDAPQLSETVLSDLACWSIRFTPVVAVDVPEGLLMDVTGCAHLWGGEDAYVRAMESRFNARGYGVRIALADTPGVAWAVARFGSGPLVVGSGKHVPALALLPPEGLRIDTGIVQRLHKLGLHRISQFMNMSRQALRRRFGQALLDQLDKASGWMAEELVPVMPPVTYSERLPCMEPIETRKGIEIGLELLLRDICARLFRDQKGLRCCVFKAYRADGKVEIVKIGTHRPTCHVEHLMRLFDHKLSGLQPGPGIELFALEAIEVEDNPTEQKELWKETGGLEDERLSELIDRLVERAGVKVSHYLPSEHYWPERSYRKVISVGDNQTVSWSSSLPRPVCLLNPPERIKVTAPIPDYPPMLFVYEGRIRRIAVADGPERIEQEWWLQGGQHRDYYRVEDEEGNRYWIFRLGHYHDTDYQWFLHGFFA